VSETITHLREIARVDVRGDKLAFHQGRALVASLHAPGERELSIVDLSRMEAPRVLSRLPFKYQMQAITVVGDVAYVFEYGRAIYLVKVGDPVRPVADDCFLMFKGNVYDFARVGERWLVLARNWEGVSVLDVSDPEHPRETDAKKLGESYVEGLAVVGERVFAASNQDGVVELRVDADGKLVEVGRWLGGEDGFRVDEVYVIGDELRVFGNGTLPWPATGAKAKKKQDADDDDGGDDDDDEDDEEYEEEPEEPNAVTFALADLSTPRWVGAVKSQPSAMSPLPDGSAIVFSGYRCYRFPAAGPSEHLFTLYERSDTKEYLEIGAGVRPEHDRNQSCLGDIAAWRRIGRHLVLQEPERMRIFEIDPRSPLAAME
jgi:hypothetical protein